MHQKWLKSKEFRRRQIFKMKIWVETLNMNTQFDTNEATEKKGTVSTNTEYLFQDKKKEIEPQPRK